MRTLRTTGLSLAIWCLLVVAGIPALQAGSLEHEFIWNEANSRMASAATEEDFLQAAEIYLKLLNSGVRNGPLFYNFGTALLKAGRYELAVNAFLRAERHMNSNPEIRRNILLARAGGDKDAQAALPWYRYFLFWHYGLSSSRRTTMAAVAFAAVWLGLALRLLGSRRVSRIIIILSLVSLVLFGSSVAASLNQETHERVMAPGSLLRESADKHGAHGRVTPQLPKSTPVLEKEP